MSMHILKDLFKKCSKIERIDAPSESKKIIRREDHITEIYFDNFDEIRDTVKNNPVVKCFDSKYDEVIDFILHDYIVEFDDTDSYNNYKAMYEFIVNDVVLPLFSDMYREAVSTGYCWTKSNVIKLMDMFNDIEIDKAYCKIDMIEESTDLKRASYNVKLPVRQITLYKDMNTNYPRVHGKLRLMYSHHDKLLSVQSVASPMIDSIAVYGKEKFEPINKDIEVWEQLVLADGDFKSRYLDQAYEYSLIQKWFKPLIDQLSDLNNDRIRYEQYTDSKNPSVKGFSTIEHVIRTNATGDTVCIIVIIDNKTNRVVDVSISNYVAK